MGGWRVVEGGKNGHDRRGRRRSVVDYNPSGCGVVEWNARHIVVGGRRHVVLRRRLVGGEEDVGGLPRRHHDYIGDVGVGVGGINRHHFQVVVRDLEK